ncbi:MAG: YceD family protein [Woeseiaceae bacterium]|nr:YceD family protein [Woeseiaceae bacterium]
MCKISETEIKAVAGSAQTRDWQDSAVRVGLSFAWLDPGMRIVSATGQVTAGLPVVCQRCLEPFELVIDTPIRMLFGESLDDSRYADYDVWEVDGTAIVLRDVVEEALVMAMPLAPLHDASTICGRQAEEIPAEYPETTRPFEDLRARMKAKD